MRKRDDELMRDLRYGGHPAACNCAACTEKKLGKLGIMKKKPSSIKPLMTPITKEEEAWLLSKNRNSWTDRFGSFFRVFKRRNR